MWHSSSNKLQILSYKKGLFETKWKIKSSQPETKKRRKKSSKVLTKLLHPNEEDDSIDNGGETVKDYVGKGKGAGGALS